MSMAATAHRSRRVALGLRLDPLIAVLGVVYGDIGTSPLYALKASIQILGDRGPTPGEVLGILSLITWSLILIVTIKYILLIMRANNNGEGGTLALMALAHRLSENQRTAAVVTVLGLLGACLFFGDGVITPAVSVLSAVEGLEVSLPSARPVVIPISIAVIVLLFTLQSRGTGRVGRLFGPIMVLWFAVIGVLGALEIARAPFVLQALLPSHALIFIVHHGSLAFVVLGAVVLAVTGAEALYADMGHFGATPIRRAWLGFVLPCLLANYLGQGALVINHPAAIANPFFLLGPHWLRLPLVLLATFATVIASQAVISGAYSVARQCVQLGFLPRMKIQHTSSTDEGQIYVPQLNSILAVGVILLVLAFRSSGNLASAYGIAVTGTFNCDCLLAMFVFHRQFGWSKTLAGLVFGCFTAIDTTFLLANALKIPEGGYVPLLTGAVLLALMTTWKRGRDLLFSRWQQESLPLSSFLSRLPKSRTIRVPGMAVFLTGNPDYVPGALLHNLKHNKVLHERVLFVKVGNLDRPEAGPDGRATVEELAPNIHRVVLHYGFMESPNIPRALQELHHAGISYDPMQVSYFLGREVLVRAVVPKLPVWRMYLYLLMARNATPTTEFFRIPSDRVVELGMRIAI
jgi:KUP system potassium uptake protein